MKLRKPWKGIKFPQKYIDMSHGLPLDDDFLVRFDLSWLRSLHLDIEYNDAKKLPSCISASMVHITNFWLRNVPLAMDIQLDRLSALVSLDICCGHKSRTSILLNFTNPKLKEFRLYFLVDDDPLQDVMTPISFIKRFHGLETLQVYLSEQCRLKNWMDAISMAHKDTLRYLALLDYTFPDRSGYDSEGWKELYLVYDAVIACLRLVQLQLPNQWGRMEMDFKV